ncbi:MAG: transglutaminase-like domain-containing protein [Phycisphaerales bacterium]
MRTSKLIAGVLAVVITGLGPFAAAEPRESEGLAAFASQPRNYRVKWRLQLNATGYSRYGGIFADELLRYAKPCYSPDENYRYRGPLPTLSGDPQRYGQDFVYDPADHAVVLPLAVASSTFTTRLETLEARAVAKRHLGFDDGGAEAFAQLGGGPGERFLSWTIAPSSYLALIDLHGTAMVTCANSALDHDQAMRVSRPDAWPDDTRSYLDHERYIESSDPAVTRWLDGLTKGTTHRIKPYPLARIIARDIVQRIRQPESTTIRAIEIGNRKGDEPEFLATRNPQGHTIGINLHGGRQLLVSGKGSNADAAALFVAAMRAAGIPSRPVIGFHTEDERGVHVWAEFYLPDMGWVPVDFERFVGSSGRMNDMSRPWDGLGAHSDLNDMIPFAYRFTPSAQVSVRSEYPFPVGFTFPTKRPVEHRLVFDVTTVETGSTAGRR